MDKIEWKPVKGFDGYEVSNTGRVRSVDRVRRVKDSHGGVMYRRDKGKELTPTGNGKGYLIVGLSDAERKAKNVYVHRIVAEAFCQRKHGKNVVNHKDRNTKNNCAENLEWLTVKENVRYSAENMRHPKNSRLPKSGEKYIRVNIRRNRESFTVSIRQKNIWKTFDNLADAVTYRNEVISDG